MKTMHFGPHPLPVPYGHFPGSVSYYPYSSEIPITLPFDLIRLHQERHILSKGLVDCVTYLKAQHEKQAKYTRQLDLQPPLPQKKRKRLQQTKRYVENGIKTRQLAEQAYLNNLQACETNIYLANIKAFQLSNASWNALETTSTPSLYTPTLCSHAETEMIDLTWEGWTDEAVVSPFQRNSNPFLGDELAPNVYKAKLRRDSAIAKDVKRPPPLIQDAVELSNSHPVPPNTASSQYSRSPCLSPVAPVFRPIFSSFVQESPQDQLSTRRLTLLSLADVDTIKTAQQRRSSAAEIIPILESFDIVAQPPPHYPPAHRAWSHIAPQPCAQKGVRTQMNRHKTNSL